MDWRLTRAAAIWTTAGCVAGAMTISLFGQAPARVPPPSGLVGIVWVLAPEQDGPNTSTFRPEGYNLPPMRGPFVKYTFHPDGTLVIRGPGPTDGEISSLYDWGMREPNVFQIRPRSGPREWSSFEIVTLTKDKFVKGGPLELTRKTMSPR